MFLVYGLFKPAHEVEQGIEKLKEDGFGKDRIGVITLEVNLPKRQRVLDSMHWHDGRSMMDGISLGAAIGMLFGVIYGTILYIGSVALGLVGMFVGGGMGFLLDRMMYRKMRNYDGVSGEIIVTVCCRDANEAGRAEGIMKAHKVSALGRTTV